MNPLLQADNTEKESVVPGLCAAVYGNAAFSNRWILFVNPSQKSMCVLDWAAHFWRPHRFPAPRPTLSAALHLCLDTSPWRWGHKFIRGQKPAKPARFPTGFCFIFRYSRDSGRGLWSCKFRLMCSTCHCGFISKSLFISCEGPCVKWPLTSHSLKGHWTAPASSFPPRNIHENRLFH